MGFNGIFNGLYYGIYGLIKWIIPPVRLREYPHLNGMMLYPPNLWWFNGGLMGVSPTKHGILMGFDLMVFLMGYIMGYMD